jgi:hypothetical protein
VRLDLAARSQSSILSPGKWEDLEMSKKGQSLLGFPAK